MNVLAHQGGWDELLLAAGVVLAFVAYSALRRRSRGARDPATHVCAYCGEPLAPEHQRCPACGFRVATDQGT